MVNFRKAQTTRPREGGGRKLFASLFVRLKLLAKIYFCLFTTVQRIKFSLSKPNQVCAGWMGLDSLAIELICLNWEQAKYLYIFFSFSPLFDSPNYKTQKVQ